MITKISKHEPRVLQLHILSQQSNILIKKHETEIYVSGRNVADVIRYWFKLKQPSIMKKTTCLVEIIENEFETSIGKFKEARLKEEGCYLSIEDVKEDEDYYYFNWDIKLLA